MSTHLNFASKSRKGKILRAVKNFNGPFITPKNLSETKCVLPLNILHCLFYIQKQKRLIPSLSFLFLFKILLMQNLNLRKTHRFIEFLIKITHTYLHM